jgi:hypothetical protein
MRTPIPSRPTRSTRPKDLLSAGFRAELDSFLLSLEAENLAPKTRRTYGEAVELLGRFLADLLWQVVESGSVPSSEVFLDVIQCAARPRRWVRLRPSEQ